MLALILALVAAPLEPAPTCRTEGPVDKAAVQARLKVIDKELRENRRDLAQDQREYEAGELEEDDFNSARSEAQTDWRQLTAEREMLRLPLCKSRP